MSQGTNAVAGVATRRAGAVSWDAAAALDLDIGAWTRTHAAPRVINGRAVSNGPTAAFSPGKRRSEAFI
jgi:hypothetical protein